MDKSTRSIYLASGTLGAGYMAYSERGCRGDPIAPTHRPPYLQGVNGGRPCVDLNKLLLPANDTVNDPSESRIRSIKYVMAGRRVTN